MQMRSKPIPLTILGLLSVLLNGCFPLSVLQSPKVIKTEGTTYGLAISSAPSGYWLNNTRIAAGGLFFYTRSRLLERTEYGLRGWGFPFIGGGISGDIKYQFFESAVSVSIDGEVSLATVRVPVEGRRGDFELSLPRARTFFGFYPTILLGTENVYGGARVVKLTSEAGSSTLPGLFIGASLGKRLRVIPEVAFYWGSNLGTIPFMGLGFQYSFESD